MDPTRLSYPVRGFIRHKARMTILTSEWLDEFCPALDETLLQDLTDTLFQSQRGEVIYQSYPTREAAEAIENQFAAEIADTYRHIKQQQTQPQIQWLNGLVSQDS